MLFALITMAGAQDMGRYGDFDVDETFTNDDLETLKDNRGTTIIAAFNSNLDVDGDTDVDDDDADYWIQDLYGTVNADFNLDCDVDWGDLAVLSANWGSTDVPHAAGDADHDGDVDAADLSYLASNWGWIDETACTGGRVGFWQRADSGNTYFQLEGFDFPNGTIVCAYDDQGAGDVQFCGSMVGTTNIATIATGVDGVGLVPHAPRARAPLLRDRRRDGVGGRGPRLHARAGRGLRGGGRQRPGLGPQAQEEAAGSSEGRTMSGFGRSRRTSTGSRASKKRKSVAAPTWMDGLEPKGR